MILSRVLRLIRRNDEWQIHATAVLHPSARVINNRGVREAIDIGAHTHIKGELLTFAHGGRIRLGTFCFLGEDSRIWSAASIDIGDRVLISHNVNIFDNSTHPIDPKQRHEQFRKIVLEGRHPTSIDLKEQSVKIEDDAWIGCTSIILSGVTVGRAAIVGAGSVVTGDVPPFTVVAGNPARIIRQIRADER